MKKVVRYLSFFVVVVIFIYIGIKIADYPLFRINKYEKLNLPLLSTKVIKWNENWTFMGDGQNEVLLKIDKNNFEKIKSVSANISLKDIDIYTLNQMGIKPQQVWIYSKYTAIIKTKDSYFLYYYYCYPEFYNKNILVN